MAPEGVILSAQVINGVLLPLVASSLLLCLNTQQLLGDNVQPLANNLVMTPCVAVAFFLACLTLVGKTVGELAGLDFGAVCAISGVLSAAGTGTVVWGCHRMRTGGTRSHRASELHAALMSATNDSAGASLIRE
jgi:hypothetical protein